MQFFGCIAWPEDVPYRVFAKGKEIPGLAMSRSVGDLAGHMAGVIHEKPGRIPRI